MSVAARADVTDRLAGITLELNAVVDQRAALRSEATVAIDEAVQLQAYGVSVPELVDGVGTLVARITEADQRLAGLLDAAAQVLGEEVAGG